MRGRLYLATSATRADAPKYSGLSVDLLREDIGGSGAAARVLILDCCFSGRAIEVMTGEDGLLDGQLSIAGTYTLTSTIANAPSYAPTGERYTAFTGALLAALDSPQPLSLNEIYRSVAADLHSRGLPRPRQRATDTAGALALVRGQAPDTPRAKAVSKIRFRPDAAAVRQFKKDARQLGAAAFILAVGPPMTVAEVTGNAAWWAGLGFTAALAVVTHDVVSHRRLPHVAELVIDRSGITVCKLGRDADTVRMLWRDISRVGVLRPQPGSPYPEMLVIRLPPQAPRTDIGDSRLSSELRKLGYLAIGTINSFGATKEQVLAALDRFAGDRVLHTEQEFLLRDPRIQPGMI